MTLELPKKFCLECTSELILKIRRDVIRKKFCNRSCKFKWLGKQPSRDKHLKRIQKLANTPESNLKKSNKGSRHPKWIKDRTKLKSKRPRYEQEQFRKAVFERDDYTCQICEIKGGNLQADHIKPYCLYPELREDINNGRTLCVDCHKNTDTYGSKALKYKE